MRGRATTGPAEAGKENAAPAPTSLRERRVYALRE
jgi:hypothetical protein